MSITFTAEAGKIVGYQAVCACPEAQPVQFTTYEAASRWYSDWRRNPRPLRDCVDDLCMVYAPMLTAVEQNPAMEVNVSQSNGIHLLRLLGIASDDPSREDQADMLSGKLDSNDFLGRVLMALAVAPVDAEISARVGLNTPNIVECGRREGYAQDRLTELHALADFAGQRDRAVIWG